MIENVYQQASHYAVADGALVLQTAAGLTPAGWVANPVFFSGTVRRPDVAAAGLRTLVEIAQTRYFKPVPGGLASLDPILTANGDRLRCEAFSACNGVYARLDLLAQALDDGALGLGTTNIDINPPLAAALAAIRPADSLHLRVGPDQVQVASPSATHTERKVDLPERWVRGLAETQSLAAHLPLRAELDALGWRRFINGLSMAGGSGAGVSQWLLPGAGHALRGSRSAQAGAISLPGSARLAALKRITHLVQRVRIHGPDVAADSPPCLSAWVLNLPGARLTLMLSPEPWRGFSGEGALLAALAQPAASLNANAQTLAGLMAWEAQLNLAELGHEARLTATEVHHAMQVLATSGQVGFDLADGSYFHRQLPFDVGRIATNYPRLSAARALLAQGAVQADGERFRVASRTQDTAHVVTPDALAATGELGNWRCTCSFWHKYQGQRGPCAHVLAAQLWHAAAHGKASPGAEPEPNPQRQ